jgi:hypothetical protein
VLKKSRRRRRSGVMVGARDSALETLTRDTLKTVQGRQVVTSLVQTWVGTCQTINKGLRRSKLVATSGAVITLAPPSLRRITRSPWFGKWLEKISEMCWRLEYIPSSSKTQENILCEA